MKVRFKNVLGGYLSLMGSALDGTIPILGGILLEAGEGELTMTATNLELGVRLEIPAEVEKEGKVVVGGKKFVNLLKIAKDEVEVEADEGVVKVKAGARYKIGAMDYRNYPEVELADEWQEVDGKELQKGLKAVFPAVSNDPARYVLNGVYLGEGEVVATDGHHMAVYSVSLKVSGVIVPRKAVQKVSDFLQKVESAKVSVKGNKFFVEGREGEIRGIVWSTLIEGEYPDYRSVFPDEYLFTVEAEKEELTVALKEAMAIFEKKDAIPVEVIAGTQGGLTLRAFSPDEDKSDEVEVSIGVEVKGMPFKVVLNGLHLFNLLKGMESSCAVLKFSGDRAPVFVEEKNGRIRGLLMPMLV